MYIFFKKGARGGIPYIFNRYSKANNKYLKSYDLKQESKHIIYLGANNLYAYEMYKFLSASGFKWIYPKQFESNKYACNSSKGCAVKVEYPKEFLESDYAEANVCVFS